MRRVAIAGGLLFAVAVLGAAEASYAQQPGKAPLTLQPVPGLGVTPSPGPAAPAPILLSGTTVAPPRSPKGRPAPATPASPPSRELTGVDFTIAGDTRSRELVGVDFVVSSDVRSRELTGVDFVLPQ